MVKKELKNVENFKQNISNQYFAGKNIIRNLCFADAYKFNTVLRSNGSASILNKRQSDITQS